jgi:hypothetical protein
MVHMHLVPINQINLCWLIDSLLLKIQMHKLYSIELLS